MFDEVDIMIDKIHNNKIIQHKDIPINDIGKKYDESYLRDSRIYIKNEL
jgi:hypothetical protein